MVILEDLTLGLEVLVEDQPPLPLPPPEMPLLPPPLLPLVKMPPPPQLPLLVTLLPPLLLPPLDLEV